jgi:CBS domain containing-hemolysin-like protein
VVAVLAAFWPLRIASNLLIRITNLMVKGKDLKEGPFLSETEFLGIVEAAAKDSVIEAEEQELIESVIEFGDTVVREIMRPRHEIITVDETVTVSEALTVAIEHQFSRMPVLRIDDDDIDDVAGTVNTKDLMRVEREGGGQSPVKDLMREAHVVPEGKPVAEIMREMQKTQMHLTIVADEYGAFSGIVTLEDCLEELVGEIVDEHDDEDTRFRVSGSDTLIEGSVGIDDVNDRLSTKLSNDEYDTIGGYVFGTIGRMPRIGDGVDTSEYRLSVEELDGRRVTVVRYSPKTVSAPNTN